MPFIGPQKGALLQQLIRERQPRQVVEVGTMCGYSALLIAQAMGPGCQLVSIEADWKWALAAKRFVWQATQGDKSSKPVRARHSQVWRHLQLLRPRDTCCVAVEGVCKSYPGPLLSCRDCRDQSYPVQGKRCTS